MRCALSCFYCHKCVGVFYTRSQFLSPGTDRGVLQFSPLLTLTTQSQRRTPMASGLSPTGPPALQMPVKGIGCPRYPHLFL